MRKALWEDCPDDQQVREMEEILASDTEAVFFAERPGGGLCGFVEASIRLIVLPHQEMLPRIAPLGGRHDAII